MKKSSRLTGLIFALMGILPLLNSLDQPRVAALHGSEVLRLVAAGMLFGVGFAGLMGRVDLPNSRKDQSNGSV
jgi:hypothetical protein